MSVYRALAACPSCNTLEEVWYYKSKITPMSTVECRRCSCLYEANNFLVSLLELRENVTLSALLLVTP